MQKSNKKKKGRVLFYCTIAKYCLRSFTTCIVAAQGQKVPVQPQ